MALPNKIILNKNVIEKANANSSLNLNLGGQPASPGVNLEAWISKLLAQGDIKQFNITPEKAAAYTAKVGDFIPVDTTGGAVTITAPASPQTGDYFYVTDSRSNAGTANITVDFGAEDFYAAAATDDTIATDELTIQYIYINATIGWISK